MLYGAETRKVVRVRKNLANIIITPGTAPGSFVVQYDKPTGAPLTLTEAICNRVKGLLREHPCTPRASVVTNGHCMQVSNLPVDDAYAGLGRLGMAVHTVLTPEEVIYKDGGDMLITPEGNIEPMYV